MTTPADTALPDLPPLSEAEQRQMLVAVERSRRTHAVLLATRGGRLFPSSGEELDDLRNERTRELP